MPVICDCPVSCPDDDTAATAAAAAAAARWQDLPPAFLCHILQLAPYKRADVKAVCCSWRAAINASITEATLPASDLHLLRQLTNIQQLVVTAPVSGSSSHNRDHTPPAANSAIATQPQTWPPSSRAANNTDESSSGGNAPAAAAATNGWSAVQPLVFRRLRSVRLSHCPAAVQQLAAALASSSSSSQLLLSLQDLELCHAGDVSSILPALLQHCSAAAGAPQLQRLCLAGCSLPGPHCLQLQQLPRLRALQVLDLSGCGLTEVPASVCSATGLTKLVLRNSLMQQLPPEIGQLQQLKVLDLSGCTRLRGLCSSFRQLSALQELRLAGPSGIWLDYSSLEASSSGTSSAAALPRFVPTAFCSSDAAGAGNPTTGGGSAAAARAALPPLLPALGHQQQLPLLPQLAGLGALSCLDLSSNRDLMVLPSCLSLLRALRLLDVRGCGLRWLNEELLECSGLRTLLLSDNVLLEVPEEIRRLQQLQVLDLGGCSSLWHLPRSLLQLPALVRLTLPSRGVGQHIVEQLELRAAPEVEVLLEPPEGASDGEEDEYAAAAAAAAPSESGDSDGDD